MTNTRWDSKQEHYREIHLGRRGKKCLCIVLLSFSHLDHKYLTPAIITTRIISLAHPFPLLLYMYRLRLIYELQYYCHAMYFAAGQRLFFQCLPARSWLASFTNSLISIGLSKVPVADLRLCAGSHPPSTFPLFNNGFGKVFVVEPNDV